jgi:hypothetical protein
METTFRRTTPKYATRPLESGAGDTAAPFAWHPAAVVFAAVCVMVGVYWDISWHMSIGRDSFWTPAHLLIQAGGLIAGFSSGYVALRTTFGSDPRADDAAVTFWGFRAPLGAWVAIWGCLAMLVSAPFDNWWHDAYGLDVKIISPPHMVLALGIAGIGIGALLLALAQQNREGAKKKLPVWLFLAAGSLLLMDRAIMLYEYSSPNQQHIGFFYVVSMLAYPLEVVLMARAAKIRWAATLTSAIFMGLMLSLMWFMQLFPATPKLGPIYQPITNMVTLDFPILIILPSIGVDLVMQRVRARPILLSAILSAVFLAIFIAVQWPFASFMLSEAARNGFWNAENFVYWLSPTGVAWSRTFVQDPPGSAPFAQQLLLAFLVGTFSSWVGLWFGAWMTKVRR